MEPRTSKTNVLIASYLEPECAQCIRELDPALDVVYEPDLVRQPRYPADHNGHPLQRDPDQERRWRHLLGEADVLFDFDRTHLEDLPDLARKVRWIQATSAGIGQLVRQMGYVRRMPGTVFTTASGVHAQPLAEFCLMSMVLFNKLFNKGVHLFHEQANKNWERYAGRDLAGGTVVIVGVGAIGVEIARLCSSLRMRVIGLKRRTEGIDPRSLHLDELFAQDRLTEVLPRAEYLILIAPHTAETEGMIGAQELALLPRGALLINIARGALVDEPALVEALKSGHLRGASLDVFAVEPLPEDHPLWTMPNVLISPHSASTVEKENQRLTGLFCENLRRYLNGEALVNVFDAESLY